MIDTTDLPPNSDAFRVWKVDELTVQVYPTRLAMGSAAASAVGKALRRLQAEKKQLRMMFAAAPSQNEFLTRLCEQPGVDWRRVVAFHIDEYLGLAADAPQLFGRFLRERLFERLHFGEVHYLNPTPDDPQTECERYARLLATEPIDIACIGVGENGHIAFNDPPVAEFDDPQRVKIVPLDTVCRRQQVHDGCFTRFEEVPTHAMTLTIPALFSAGNIFCIVPSSQKALAVKQMLQGPVSSEFPASILRMHPRANLFLDRAAAGLMK